MTGRSFPDRPYLAVSAAIIRDGRVLVVRRARPPAQNLFTLPGGVVEGGETLAQAVIREILEEAGIVIDPVGLAGYREVIRHADDNRVEHHYVILTFAARWLSGEFKANEELVDGHWMRPSDVGQLSTTEGLAEIIASAFELVGAEG